MLQGIEKDVAKMEPEFTCRACRKMRPNSMTAVKTIDTSERHGLIQGTCRENFVYCTDKPACVQAAKDFDGYDKPKAK